MFFTLGWVTTKTRSPMEKIGDDLALELEEPGNKELALSPNRRDGITGLLDMALSLDSQRWQSKYNSKELAGYLRSWPLNMETQKLQWRWMRVLICGFGSEFVCVCWDLGVSFCVWNVDSDSSHSQQLAFHMMMDWWSTSTWCYKSHMAISVGRIFLYFNFLFFFFPLNELLTWRRGRHVHTR